MNKNMFTRLLLSAKDYSPRINWVLFLFRIAFGIAFFSHGFSKWSNFHTMADAFPDPLGIGSSFSLGLAIFGEAICSLAVIIGLFHRLALIPMIITMGIAFFVIHCNDPFATKELSFVYLIAFVGLFITGPGRISADYLLFRKK